MTDALRECPFCKCEMRIESNRDWHTLHGNHTEECFFSDDEMLTAPATPEGLKEIYSCWQTRAHDDDLRAVERTLQTASRILTEQCKGVLNGKLWGEDALTRLKKMRGV